MSAESEIYSTLSGDVDVAALVGVRIYPDMIEQGADVPAIAYSRASTDLEQTIGGAIITTTTTMVLTCLDDGKAGAEDLADKVVFALQTAGIESSSSPTGTWIKERPPSCSEIRPGKPTRGRSGTSLAL